MRLRVNGEDKEGIAATTVGGLLRELGIESGRVAVEVNLMIVRKSEFDLFPLGDGDTVEIINFVGGGSHPPAGNSDGNERRKKWKIHL